MNKIILFIFAICKQNQVISHLPPSKLNVEKIKLVVNNYFKIDLSPLFDQLDLSLPTLRISSNFIAQLMTIIFQEQDIRISTANFQSFFDEFEINLNTDTMQPIFKKTFEKLEKVEFLLNFNTSLHTKLNTQKCRRDKFQLAPNDKNAQNLLSCLTVPFHIEIFGHKYLSLLKVEFYFLKTISYTRFVLTNMYFDFYEDYSGDDLLKAEEFKEFLNQTLFYAVGSFNFAFSKQYQNYIYKFQDYCERLNIKQDDEEYYLACY